MENIERKSVVKAKQWLKRSSKEFHRNSEAFFVDCSSWIILFSLLGTGKCLLLQRAKKVVSGSLGPVDFAVGLVNSVLNLPNGQEKYFEEFNFQKNCKINSALPKILGAS